MRKLLLIALLAAACSYSDEKADIKVTVDLISVEADHLDVVLTYSDTTVSSKNCSTDVSTAQHAICYRPSFQPGALNPPRMELDFAAASVTGTVTIDVTAKDKDFSPKGHGTKTANLPGPLDLQITLQ